MIDELYNNIFEIAKIRADTGESGNRKERFKNLIDLYESTLYLSHRQPTAEAGCWKGMSSYLMLKYAECLHISKANHYIFDSFEGLSAPNKEDLEGSSYTITDMTGRFASPIERTQQTLEEFNDIILYNKGWIPDVYNRILPSEFSFVHIDVELFEPTLASLEFFYPKLQLGGILVCDDCNYHRFPGSHKAMELFCSKNNLKPNYLKTGNGFLVKE